MRPLFLAASALIAAWPAHAAADWSDWSISPVALEYGNWTGSIGGSVSGAAYESDQPRRAYYPGLTGSLLITPRLTYALANGWEIGAGSNVLVYRDELSGDLYDDRLFEKAYVWLLTQYGRLELGQQDGAAYSLSVVGPKVDDALSFDAASVTLFRNPATGEPLADVFKLVTGEFATGNFAKFSYYTPRLYGIELAGSFTPYEARNGIPFAGTGRTGTDRQTNLLEAAANYDGTWGPFSTDAYAAAAIGHDSERTDGHSDLLDWGFGGALGIEIGETNFTWGSGFRQANAYAFDIDEAFRNGTTTLFRLSMTATNGPWIAGIEVIDGFADSEEHLPGLHETGFEPSLGYVVNANLQLTFGWQLLRLNQDAIAGTPGDTVVNAVFLHAGLHV